VAVKWRHCLSWHKAKRQSEVRFGFAK